MSNRKIKVIFISEVSRGEPNRIFNKVVLKVTIIKEEIGITSLLAFYFLLENGLKQAERVTNALYKGSVDGLGELNYAEIRQTFAGATLVDILPEPGMSMLQLAMKAKCFPTESKRTLHAN